MPTGFEIGPLTIRYYGIIIMVGALAGAWLASWLARRKGENPELVWDGLVWALIGGIIGARIWHILTPPPSSLAVGVTTKFYLTHPLDAIAVWRGGLGIPGAVIGGFFALYLFSRRHQLNFLLWIDIAAPGLALGQAIGRWGNYVNQELYGYPSQLPWAIRIDPQHRLPGFEEYERFHPLFLYESIWNFGIVFILLWITGKFKNQLINGDVFLVYLILQPLGRFFLEFLRVDRVQLAGVNANQTFMAVVAITAAVILVLRHARWKEKSLDSEVAEE